MKEAEDLINFYTKQIEKLKQDKQELIDKIKLERYLVNECKPHYIEYVDSAEESCRKTLDFIIEEVLEKLGE